MSDDNDPDWMFQNHPDLIDKRWAKKEAKAARKRARKYRAEETGGPSKPRGPYRRLRLIAAAAVVVAGGATDPYAYYDPNHTLNIPNSC